MVTSSKRSYAIPKSAGPEPLSLQQSTADLYLHRRHSNTVLSVSVGCLGPGAYKVCLSPLSISGRRRVRFYMQICPSYCLTGDSLTF